MKILFTTLTLLIAIFQISISQSVGIGTASPNANAILELNSSTQGFLMPRMKTSERIVIPHTQGLMVFDKDNNSPYFNNGEQWIEVKPTAASAGSEIVDTDGDTKVQTEKSSDNDKIIFTINEIEYFTMSGKTIEVNNTG